ncbi:MAG: HK97 gp10 family phage protein [Clostridium sp.]
MGLDYSEFLRYAENFKIAQIEFQKFIFDFLTKNAMEALAKTKKRTPVDTGELRRNWGITRVIRRGNDLVVYLFNNKNYASYVEDGHATVNREGWVEGYYMATISIEEIDSKIPKRFESEFKRFMEGLNLA